MFTDSFETFIFHHVSSIYSSLFPAVSLNSFPPNQRVRLKILQIHKFSVVASVKRQSFETSIFIRELSLEQKPGGPETPGVFLALFLDPVVP